MPRIRACVAVALVLVGAICISVHFGRVFRTQLETTGTAVVQEILQKQINKTCQGILNTTAATPIAQSKNESGVTQITVDAEALGKMAAACATQCEQDLAQYDVIALQLPLGAVTGSTALADKGRTVTYNAHVSYTLDAHYYTACEAVGINQIRYAVYLEVDADAHITIPSIIRNAHYTYYVPVCETVYSGSVPNVYVSGEKGLQYLDLIP